MIITHSHMPLDVCFKLSAYTQQTALRRPAAGYSRSCVYVVGDEIITLITGPLLYVHLCLPDEMPALSGGRAALAYHQLRRNDDLLADNALRPDALEQQLQRRAAHEFAVELHGR